MGIDYAGLLDRSRNEADNDKRIFELYRNKGMSIDECFKDFLKNNGYCEDDYELDPESFRKFMRSLGF